MHSDPIYSSTSISIVPWPYMASDATTLGMQMDVKQSFSSLATCPNSRLKVHFCQAGLYIVALSGNRVVSE